MSEQLQTPPDRAGVVIPPLVVVLVVLGVALVLQSLLPLPVVPASLAQPAAWALMIVGLLVLACGLGTLLAGRTNPLPWAPASTLVCAGVYRFTRNPMYLGGLIVYIGLALLLACTWALLLLPAFVLGVDRLVIEKEEQYLERKFGDEYRSYATRVRRWI